MATQINYLSLALTIGGHHLILETEKIPSKDAIKGEVTSMGDQLKDMMLSLSFKMEKGKVIEVSLEDFFTSVSKQIGDVGIGELRSFFTVIAGATTNINIDLWDLSFTTGKILANPNKGKLNFAFKVRVKLDNKFYDELKIPKEITEVIAVDSLGLGIEFYKEFTL